MSRWNAEMISEKRAKLFWSKIDIKDESDCWEWELSKDINGYGLTTIKDINARSHRVAYTIVKGNIPEGLSVCHRCDNPPCCNPKHLFLGSVSDNSKDMTNKDRQAKGINIGSARLTDEKVKKIRELYPLFKQDRIANMFDIDQTTVSKVILRKTWKHVT